MKTLKEYLNESLLDDFGEQSKDAAKRHAIESWLEKNHVSANRNRWPLKYKINKDYTIDTDIFLYVGEGNFPEFIQFNKCNGNFLVSNGNMTSLRGCPQYVRGNFDCSDNFLKTLDGGPRTVKGSYFCRSNTLQTLDGGPTNCNKIYINENPELSDDEIKKYEQRHPKVRVIK